MCTLINKFIFISYYFDELYEKSNISDNSKLYYSYSTLRQTSFYDYVILIELGSAIKPQRAERLVGI